MDESLNHIQLVKLYAKVNGRDVLPDVKLPKIRKKRAVETKKRDMREKLLEHRIIMALKFKPWIKFGKTECSATYNNRHSFHGFSDLTIFNLNTKTLWFMECKSENGVIGPKQKMFESYCKEIGGNVKHIFVRSVEEAMVVV